MIVGTLVMTLWRMTGLLLTPLLFFYNRSRPHLWRVPIPSPGRTWVHGASIGEHQNISALLPHLGPIWPTHSSWRSRPKGTFPAPLDLPGIIGPWLDHARPSRLILLEGELWPGWLSACRKRGIPVVVLGARKGPGWNRWQRFPSLFEWITRDIQFLYAENIGDLKRATPLPPAAFEVRKPAIVGSSTRRGDEERLLAAWFHLPRPRPLLILAPRHLERSDYINELLVGLSVSRRSEGLDTSSDIWLLDTHGELAGIMADVHIAYIGGTFDKEIGGHSPAEALQGGAHILHGPQTHANPTAWEEIETECVDSKAHLIEALQRLMRMPRPKQKSSDIEMSFILESLPAPVYKSETHGPAILWPLVPLWSLLSRIVRRTQGQANEEQFVVVGGLVNGGAGRTPIAAWLAEHLQNTFVVGAGYKRKGGGKDLRIAPPNQIPVAGLGDELEMIRRRGHRVISAPHRLKGIAQGSPNEIPIVDGGLGDPRLHKGYRIACIDAWTPGGRGPFPVGSRRLPWTTLNDVNAIWISNSHDAEVLPKLPQNIPIVRSTMRPEAWIHKGKTYPLDAIQGEIDVVVGIARPERFICTLLDLHLVIRSVRYMRDHAELGTLPKGVVLTEKDAARLPVDADVWALRMELDVEEADTLIQNIQEHCT